MTVMSVDRYKRVPLYNNLLFVRAELVDDGANFAQKCMVMCTWDGVCTKKEVEFMLAQRSSSIMSQSLFVMYSHAYMK